MLNVRIRTAPGARLPSYATDGSAGADIYALIPEESGITLEPGERALVPTGLFMALPTGYEAQIRPRSGLAAKHGITLLNSPGTIDSDYRGEVKVIVINHGGEPYTIHSGERIAQMVIAPVSQAGFEQVMDIDETSRGLGGFGSTGK